MRRLSAVLAVVLGSCFVAGAQPSSDRPVVYMVGNAHLDTQWRWDIQQTIGEFLPNTLRQNFALFEEFPDYVFSFEGAVKYAWAKEYYPDLYESLKKYISQGRWRVAGSSWDANDPNLPSTEATIRNFLYGERFFLEEFGVMSHDVMLPDCFGFGWQLPSVAAHCGLNAFGTQKLQWRARPFYPDGRRFPFRFGVWQGVDGSRIMANLDGGNYSWNPDCDLTDYPEFKERIAGNTVPAAYRYFGTRSSRLHDDQGGSPTPSAVALVDYAAKHPKDYQVRFAGAEDMYRDFYMAPGLPEHNDELLMDIHATGCYSSHSELKRLNRLNEWLLVSAEQAGVLANVVSGFSYPSRTIDDCWKRTVLHQFHDDLTGTSIPAAYRFSYNDHYVTSSQLRGTLEAEVLSAASALGASGIGGIPVAVYNPVSASNSSYSSVRVPWKGDCKGAEAVAPTGGKVRAQVVSCNGGMAEVIFAGTDPSLSVSLYDIRPVRKVARNESLKAYGNVIENKVYKVTVGADGDICSIVDKRCGRELVAESESFGLQMFENNESNNWPSWEIFRHVMERKPSKASKGVKVSVEECGPLRAVLCVERKFGESTFVQRIMLTDGAQDDRIDIETMVDWKSRATLLKAAFPMSFGCPEATYDLGMANIRRGNNTDLKYEVFAHQWADLTAEDGSYGVTIMNTGKYGWDKPADNCIRLTLLHTPTAVAYDEWQACQDIGKHVITYSIVGHAGPLDPVRADILSDCLNQPEFCYQAAKTAGSGRCLSMLSSDSKSIRVKALKRAYDGDGFVVRTYELSGKGASAALTFDFPIASAEELNGIEMPVGSARFEGNKLFVDAGPFQMKTFRVRPAKVADGSDKFTCVNLPYDKMALTTDAFSAFGHMDDEWHSYAAELIPEDFEFRGVPFKLGRPNYDDAVVCRGQKVTLPEGTTKVCVLAAASSPDDQVAVFDAGTPVKREVCSWTGQYGVYGWEGYYESMLKDGEVAFLGTHRHHSRTRNEVYTETYMYYLEVPVSCGELKLPDNPSVTVFAVTAAR